MEFNPLSPGISSMMLTDSGATMTRMMTNTSHGRSTRREPSEPLKVGNVPPNTCVFVLVYLCSSAVVGDIALSPSL